MENYQKVLGEWLAGGKAPLPMKRARNARKKAEKALPKEPNYTVADLAKDYLAHCQEYYRTPEGKPGKEILYNRLASQDVKGLLGRLPTADNLRFSTAVNNV